MQAHEEHASVERRRVRGDEAERRERHHRDLEALHEAHQAPLLDLVGELPRGRGEDEERSDEDGADHEARGGGIHAAPLGRVVGGEQREGELEEVVVGRAEELRPEERAEAALGKQAELALARHHECSRMKDSTGSRESSRNSRFTQKNTSLPTFSDSSTPDSLRSFKWCDTAERESVDTAAICPTFSRSPFSNVSNIRWRCSSPSAVKAREMLRHSRGIARREFRFITTFLINTLCF